MQKNRKDKRKEPTNQDKEQTELEKQAFWDGNSQSC